MKRYELQVRTCFFVTKLVENMFDIKILKIYEKCQYRKNLEAGEYPFGETKLKEFFGKNVTLHTIVGKNGSGKSSLLDIMFRMVNNVGAVMCKQESRDASAKVRYARHIYADLEYEKTFEDAADGGIHHCKLCCRDTSLWIEFDSKVYWLSDGSLRGASEENDTYYDSIKEGYSDEDFYDISDLRPLENKRLLGQLLFYTVATNYSMLGFQSADYDDEDSLEWEDEIFVVTDEHAYVATDDGKFVVTSDWVKKKNWLKGVFHKNDGYMCPIVLNPFRDGGKINMDTEAALTVNRLSALLISERMDKQPLIEDSACHPKK